MEDLGRRCSLDRDTFHSRPIPETQGLTPNISRSGTRTVERYVEENGLDR